MKRQTAFGLVFLMGALLAGCPTAPPGELVIDIPPGSDVERVSETASGDGCGDCPPGYQCREGLCVCISHSVAWERRFGSDGPDGAVELLDLGPRGFIAVGNISPVGVSTGTAHLALLNVDGNIQWETPDDWAGATTVHAALPLGDGVAMVGEVLGSKEPGAVDGWFRVAREEGETLLNRTYGGDEGDVLHDLLRLDDGFVFVGITHSWGAGDHDGWLVRTDDTGTKLWDRTYGGVEYDGLLQAARAGDGGFYLLGETVSAGEGQRDLWLVRTDELGEIQWERTYGGHLNETVTDVLALTDGLIVAGWTESKGAGDLDGWVLSIDDFGEVRWEQTYGGQGWDRVQSVTAVEDGYLLAGGSKLSDNEESQAWLLEITDQGEIVWQKKLGGALTDDAAAAVPLEEGGLVFLGTSHVGDEANADCWMVKLFPSCE